MSATCIARILNGSHLFGTNTENSDTDYKSVVLPGREEILLGRVNWSSSDSTSGDRKANTSVDIDDEVHDLLRFTNLLETGQPMAIEMLFAPPRFHTFEPHPAWKALSSNTDKIISRASDKFLGYCRKQAMSHGLRGERVEAADKAHVIISALVDEHGPKARVGPFIDMIIDEASSEHIRREAKEIRPGSFLSHLLVSNKLVAETESLGMAQMLASKVVQEYGRRARAAREAGGKDWKALSHALRIGYEAVELFTDGHITLPRPEAAHLKAVKLGLVDGDEVGAEIVSLLAKVESASERSGLPESADREFLNSVVIEAYGEVVADVVMSQSVRP